MNRSWKNASLEPRMCEILARHASGLTLRQVSMEMYLSYSSVASTIQEIRRRLRAKTLAACVIRARELGYLDAPDDRGVVSVSSSTDSEP